MNYGLTQWWNLSHIALLCFNIWDFRLFGARILMRSRWYWENINPESFLSGYARLQNAFRPTWNKTAKRGRSIFVIWIDLTKLYFKMISTDNSSDLPQALKQEMLLWYWARYPWFTWRSWDPRGMLLLLPEALLQHFAFYTHNSFYTHNFHSIHTTQDRASWSTEGLANMWYAYYFSLHHSFQPRWTLLIHHGGLAWKVQMFLEVKFWKQSSREV